jgi:hypothetical protein
MTNDFHVLALIKGEEIYIYVYDQESRALLPETLKSQAAEPALGLNWFDAAVLNRRADEQTVGVRF